MQCLSVRLEAILRPRQIDDRVDARIDEQLQLLRCLLGRACTRILAGEQPPRFHPPRMQQCVVWPPASLPIESLGDRSRRRMHAAMTDQPDVQARVFDDLDRARNRVVDPLVVVAEHSAAHPGQQHDVRSATSIARPPPTASPRTSPLTPTARRLPTPAGVRRRTPPAAPSRTPATPGAAPVEHIGDLNIAMQSDRKLAPQFVALDVATRREEPR